MPTKKKSVTAYLTEEEYNAVRANSNRAGLSLSRFLVLVSQGQEVKSLEHQEARLELRKLKGDLGRIGGLVKQALANGADRTTVHKLLHELDERQREIQKAISQL